MMKSIIAYAHTDAKCTAANHPQIDYNKSYKHTHTPRGTSKGRMQSVRYHYYISAASVQRADLGGSIACATGQAINDGITLGRNPDLEAAII